MSAALRLAIILTIAVLALAAPGSAHARSATAPILITGSLNGADENVAMEAVDLEINGQPIPIESDGSFTGQVSASPYYQLNIGGNAVFASVQTFGHQELLKRECGCLQIPTIELVARKAGRIELFFAGDAMAGRRYLKPPRGIPRHIRHGSIDADLDKLLAPMKPYIETADIASVNLETVLAHEAPADPMDKRIVFYSVPQLASALKRAGFDHVTLGNNHIFDYRDPGMKSTFGFLDDAGMPHSGAGYDADEALTPHVFELGEKPLAMLGVVGTIGSQKAHQAATENKGGAGLGYNDTVREIVDRERRGGAVPILQYHGGSEYSLRPTERTERRLRIAAERGSPVVIGHHPHVTQGLEVYSGVLVAYSIGNFLFDQNFPETMPGYVLRVWLDGNKFHRAEVVPIFVLDYRPVPAVGSVREYVLRRVMALSEELDTKLVQSGGHAVLTRGIHKVPRRAAVCGDAAEADLSALFARRCGRPGQQFGQVLVPGGDFENAMFGSARDRRWGAEGADLEFAQTAALNRYADVRRHDGGAPAYVYTMSYLRNVRADRVTVEFDVRTLQAHTVEMLVKARPVAGAPAGKRWAGQLIDTVRIVGDPDWQKVQFEFVVPRDESGSVLDFRPILKLSAEDADPAQEVWIDNLDVIAWQSDDDRDFARESIAWSRTETRVSGTVLTAK